MISITTPADGLGGQLKIAKGQIEPSFWINALNTPLKILNASNNHFHIPIALSFYVTTNPINIYAGGFGDILLVSAQLLLTGGSFGEITRFPGDTINPGGAKGVYNMEIKPKTLVSYLYDGSEPASDLYIRGSVDDVAADMPPIDYQLLYLIFKP